MIRSDTLIPLTGGAYQARSGIADFEICENCWPEVNPQDQETPTPTTHYPREGIRTLSYPPAKAAGRGLFTASTGKLYAAVGNTLYYIDAIWKWHALGTITALTTPISMADDGNLAIVVDGTTSGYQINLVQNVFSNIFDPTGAFQGSNRVDFSDTFFAFATPGTNEWLVSNPNSATFNVLQTAAKDSKPDPIETIAFNLRVAWLLGAQSSEAWFLAGSTPFPYQEWPNVFIPYGCAAPYSLTRADIDLFWLSRNDQGQSIAVKTRGYQVEAFSTRALEYEWSKYPTVADAIGGTFQQAGHTFIVFHFPSADKTWGYDLATRQWHRRSYTDRNGVAHRERASFYASVGAQSGYPTTIVGQDWQTGQIYALDPLIYTDNGFPIVCRRSFPHQLKDMKEITHVAFVADYATGGTPGTSEPVRGPDFNNDYDSSFLVNSFGAQTTVGGSGDYNKDFNKDFLINVNSILSGATALSMRYSKDGGSTWSNYRQKGRTTSGNYRSMMRWRGLGMGRDWVFELLWVSQPGCALQGAYADTLGHSA